MDVNCILDTEHFMVQSDWQKSVNSDRTKDSLWVGYQVFGKPAEFGSLSGRLESEFCKVQYNSPYLEISRGEKTTSFLPPNSELSTIHAGKEVLSVDVNISGNLGVSCDSWKTTALVWSTHDSQIQARLVGHLLDIYKCRFFASGEVILTGSGDTQLKIWSLPTGQCVRTLQGHTQGVEDLALVGVGEQITSVSRDGTCRLWNCGTAKTVCTVSPAVGPLNTVAIMPSRDDLCVVGGHLGKAALCCFKSASVVGTTEFACSESVNCAVWIDDNIALFGCENGFIHMFDIRSPGAAICVRKDERGSVRSLTQNQGDVFASFGDGSICVVKERDCSTLTRLPSVEFTGPDCDSVNDITIQNDSLYSACRDGIIRQYNL